MRNAMAIFHPKSAPFQTESKVLYAKELYPTADNTVSASDPIYIYYIHVRTEMYPLIRHEINLVLI